MLGETEGGKSFRKHGLYGRAGITTMDRNTAETASKQVTDAVRLAVAK